MSACLPSSHSVAQTYLCACAFTHTHTQLLHKTASSSLDVRSQCNTLSTPDISLTPPHGLSCPNTSLSWDRPLPHGPHSNPFHPPRGRLPGSSRLVCRPWVSIPWVEKGTARGNSKLVAIRTRGPVVFLFKVSESHLSRRNQQRARQTWQWARSCQQVKGMLPPG